MIKHLPHAQAVALVYVALFLPHSHTHNTSWVVDGKVSHDRITAFLAEDELPHVQERPTKLSTAFNDDDDDDDGGDELRVGEILIDDGEFRWVSHCLMC